MHLEKLKASVAKTKGANASAVALIKGFSQFIRDHAGDEAAILAYADELDATSAELGQAVADNPLPT